MNDDLTAFWAIPLITDAHHESPNTILGLHYTVLTLYKLRHSSRYP